jgi:hypothetical protein
MNFREMDNIQINVLRVCLGFADFMPFRCEKQDKQITGKHNGEEGPLEVVLVFQTGKNLWNNSSTRNTHN